MKGTILAELIRSRLLAFPDWRAIELESMASRVEISRLEISRSDLSAAFDALRKYANSYLESLVGLLEQHEIELSWYGGAPVLDHEGAAAWGSLVDDFEPDILLCAHLYHDQGKSSGSFSLPGPIDLSRWGANVSFSDNDLTVLLSRGVADMHVHLGGTRQPADVWRRICSRRLGSRAAVKAPDLRRIRPPTVSADLYRHIKQARALRERMVGKCGELSPIAFVREERYFYLELFQRIGMAPGTPQATEAMHYFWTKHQLWRSLRQPQEGAVPGLKEFGSVWFRAVPKEGVGKMRRPRLLSAVFKEHSASLSALLQQPDLRRLELRLSPLGRALSYCRFVKGWSYAEKKLRGDLPAMPQIAFAVHLQRNLHAEYQNTLIQFDRETAEFHRFRVLWPEEAARFARIDLASDERSGPARMAAPFFRLLRGDRELHQLLAAGRVRGDRLRYWRDLASRGSAVVSLGAPRLGACCHAGEDFGALLIGLKEVADAIDGLRLGVGDSIGHGLAMGWDPELFEHQHGHSTFVPVGELLDSLIWARLEMMQCSLGELDDRFANDVEHWLDDRVSALYGDEAGSSLRSNISLAQYRAGCLSYPFLTDQVDRSGVRDLVAMRFENAELISRFSEQLIWARCPERRMHGKLLAWLQRRLRLRCAERGIVVELHPSSNMRITGLGDLRRGPTMALLTASESFGRAIGTDDPGVFSTDIRIEYALVFHELLSRGWSRADSLQLLERCRRTALEGIRWPAL